MARVRIDDGPRYAEQDDILGVRVEVATGYDGKSDSWPVHIYAIRPNGSRNKLLGSNIRGDSLDEALAAGFSVAHAAVERGELS